MHRRRFLMALGLGLAAPALRAEFTPEKPPLEYLERNPPIPDFKLDDLTGKEHSPGQYQGRILMFNFWSTGCSPCLAEMASMGRLWEQWKDRPFNILAIAMGQTAGQLQDYAAKNPHPFPLLPDPDGSVSSAFGVQGLPTTYLATRSGRLVYKAEGGRQWDSPRMQRAVELLLIS